MSSPAAVQSSNAAADVDSRPKASFEWSDMLLGIQAIRPQTMRFVSETILNNPHLASVFLDGHTPLLNERRFGGSKTKLFKDVDAKLKDFDENSKTMAQIIVFVRLLLDHCYRHQSRNSKLNLKLEVCMMNVEQLLLVDPSQVTHLVFDNDVDATGTGICTKGNMPLTYTVDKELHQYMKGYSNLQRNPVDKVVQ
jgi:hypothetical protein